LAHVRQPGEGSQELPRPLDQSLMIGGGELRQPEGIALHGRPGLRSLCPGTVENQPEGGHHREQDQQEEAEARE